MPISGPITFPVILITSALLRRAAEADERMIYRESRLMIEMTVMRQEQDDCEKIQTVLSANYLQVMMR